MCLIPVSVLEERKLKSKLAKRAIDGIVSCYKILKVDTDKGKVESEIYNYEWKVGKINVSNNNQRSCVSTEIDDAFHVFINAEDAIEDNTCGNQIVRVKCDLKDLVAVGKYTKYESATFTKLFLPREGCVKHAY